MTEHVLLNGVSRADRNEAISTATDAVQKGGGWVEDVHFFSNAAVNIRCAVAVSAAASVAFELRKLRIGLGPEDTVVLDAASARLANDQELTFSIQITFVHDEPDLRRHVPSVPG